MFGGWSRFFGSILGGPLGYLGRPPGASKAKAVSRVCVNSVDQIEEELENDKSLEDVSRRNQSLAFHIRNRNEWFRSMYPLFSAALQLHLRRSTLVQSSFERPTNSTGSNFQPIQPAFSIQPITYVKDQSKSSLLAKNLLRLTNSTSITFCDDRHLSETNGAISRLQETSVDHLNNSNSACSLTAEKPKTETDILKDYENFLEQDEPKRVLNSQNEVELESDLAITKDKIDAALLGLQGIDLMLEGEVQAGMHLLKLAAKQEDPEALYNLGVIYEQGLYGQRQNYKRAFKCYRTSANLKYPEAFYNLAVLYKNGFHGLTEDLEKAEALFREAARLGVPEAVKNFNDSKMSEFSETCRQYDENGRKDEVTSVHRYKPDKNLPRDLFRLARAFHFGVSGMPVNKKKALELYEMASSYCDEARADYISLRKEIHAEISHHQNNSRPTGEEQDTRLSLSPV